MRKILEKKKIIVIVAALVIIASIICFCCFNNKKVEVSIMSDNNVLEVLKIKKGTTIKDIEKPSLEGKEFLYWEVDGKKVNDNYKITKNSKIKAVFKEDNTCNITYVIDDATIIEESVECGKTIEISSTALDLIDTSKFLYWEVDGEELDTNLIVKEDLILKSIYSNQVYYKVSFDSQGGSNVKTQTVESGGKVIMPTNPTKKGYVFVGWQLNGSDYDFNNEVTKDIVLKAKWSKSASRNTTNNTTQNSTMNNTNSNTNNNTKYWSVYVINNGKRVEYKVEDGKTIKLPTPIVPEGKVFQYWSDSDTGKEFSLSTQIHKNYRISAVYGSIDNQSNNSQGNIQEYYNVTFNSNGGTPVQSQNVYYKDNVYEPQNPTKKGYVFVEWQLNGKKFNFSSKLTSDITLNAVWENIPAPSVISSSRTNSSNGNATVTYYFDNNDNYIYKFSAIQKRINPVSGASQGVQFEYYTEKGATSYSIQFEYGFLYEIKVARCSARANCTDTITENSIDLRPNKISSYTVTHSTESNVINHERFIVTVPESLGNNTGLAIIHCTNSVGSTCNFFVNAKRNSLVVHFEPGNTYSGKLYLTFYKVSSSNNSIFGYSTNVEISVDSFFAIPAGSSQTFN